MAKKIFKATVTRTYDFGIEFDTDVWNDQKIAEWQKSFYEADTLEEVAEIFAKLFATQGEGKFLEGFGIPMIDGDIPLQLKLIVGGGKQVNRTINVIGLDADMEVDIEELQQSR